MPLTDEQRKAVEEMRTSLTGENPFQLGTAESVDQRARRPDPAHLPADVTVRVEIAPSSPHPHPLLDSRAPKRPERVPVYFYALRGDRAEPEVTADTIAIFSIHGGGNLTGHPTDALWIHFYAQLLRAAAAHAGNASKCVLVAPSYRLATVPENTFPAALQDVVAAYEYVLGKGYNASNIVVSGDSAGGNHAVVLTHLILQSNLPAPRGVIPIAPAAIQVYDRLSEHARAQAGTDILTVPLLEIFASAYVGDSGASPMDPFVSGAFIPFTPSWPKTLILVSSGDMLIDASRELERRLSALDLRVPVELVEYDALPHAWWLMPQIFPEYVYDAVQRIARFVLESPFVARL